MTRIVMPDNQLIMPGHGLAGYYKIEAAALNKSGTERYRRVVADWFPNLITDAGLNAIGTCNSLMWANQYASSNTVPFGCCKVGAGTTPPQVTDTILESFIAGASRLQASSVLSGAAPNWYTGAQNTFRFDTGVAAGNLSEIGMGYNNNNTGVLASRALILDGSGNPTTITILTTEVLDVTYQLRSYAPNVDGSGTFIISGVNYSYVKRAYAMSGSMTDIRSTSMTALSGDIGNGSGLTSPGSSGISGGYSPFGGGPETFTTAPYVDGSLVRDCTFSVGLNRGNLNAAGINTIGVRGALGGMQFYVTPNIPKDNTKVMTINARFGPWGRYTGAP